MKRVIIEVVLDDDLNRQEVLVETVQMTDSEKDSVAESLAQSDWFYVDFPNKIIERLDSV